MSATVPSRTSTEIGISQQAKAARLFTWVSAGSLPVLVIVILIIASATTPSFLTFDNLRAILINVALVGVVAVGMTPIMLSGNFISLSISQSTMLASILFIGLQSVGMNFWLAALVSLVVSILVGLAQGVVVAAGLNPIITTLAAGSIIYAVVTWVTEGKIISAPNADFSWVALSSFLGLPLPVYIFIAFTVLVTIFVSKTVAGRKVTLTGANQETAALSGISGRRSTLIAYLIFGVGATVGGIIASGQGGQTTSSDLSYLTESVIAAVLVGGVAIQGGFGSPVRSAIGAIITAILTNVMVLHDLPHGVRTTIIGAIVLIVVSTLHVIRRRAV